MSAPLPPLEEERGHDFRTATAKATVWLLAAGWKRHGLLWFDERPG